MTKGRRRSKAPENPGGVVHFYEHGREYFWHIPSGIVTNVAGRLVAIDCYKLETARRKVRERGD